MLNFLYFNPIIVLFLTVLFVCEANAKEFQSYYSLISNGIITYPNNDINDLSVFQSYYSLISNKGAIWSEWSILLFQSYYSLISNYFNGQYTDKLFVFQSYYSLISNSFDFVTDFFTG